MIHGIWPTVALISILALLLIYAIIKDRNRRKLHKRWMALRSECNKIIFAKTSPGSFRDAINKMLFDSEKIFKASKDEKAFRIALANSIDRLAQTQIKKNHDQIDHLTQTYYEQYQSQNN